MKSGRFSESGLLLFNLETDAEHPILGFTTQWIRALAERVRSIDVITMRAGVIDVPPNVRVHSVGREHGYSEPRRVLEFYRHLFRILRTQRIDGCFSHMMPPFSVLGGPILRARRIPLVTWYAHPSLILWVRLAHFFSNRMVTSLPHAYPYRKGKLSVIGQGIDTALFAASPAAVGSDDLILCAGRISRVKNHPTLLRAAAFLRIPFRLVILGATAGADDEIYARELKQLASELGLEDSVTFASPVPRGELPEHYRRCAVHVNLTPSGFGDKVAWEAMSCGRPCLVANDDFRETLGEHTGELLFRNGDAIELAQKLAALLAKSSTERAAIGADLRAQVERLHSLPRLAERILEELARCSSKPRGRTQPHSMKNGNSTSYSYALGNKYRTTARLLRDEAGTLLDVGSRDCILQKFLPPGQLSYFSADVAPGLDYQIDLEKPLPFDDKSFDHVVALDVLEHVNDIHGAFAELLRVAGSTVIIALPNLASIRHRLSFLFRGKMGTGKYDLRPEGSGDRHHWLTVHPQINRFVEVNAPKHEFRLNAVVAEAEHGFRRMYLPGAAICLALGIFTGLASTRAIYQLVRNGRPLTARKME